jgi:hypothetical protein
MIFEPNMMGNVFQFLHQLIPKLLVRFGSISVRCATETQGIIPVM